MSPEDLHATMAWQDAVPPPLNYAQLRRATGRRVREYRKTNRRKEPVRHLREVLKEPARFLLLCKQGIQEPDDPPSVLIDKATGEHIEFSPRGVVVFNTVSSHFVEFFDVSPSALQKIQNELSGRKYRKDYTFR